MDDRADEATPGYIRASRYLVAASVLVPLLLFGIVAWLDREAVLRALERETRTTADVFQQHALNVFETHELIAREIDEHIRAMSWDEIAGSEPLHLYMKGLESRYPQVQGLWLADASGTVRNASRAHPTPPVSLADRDYFKALQADDLGTFIGQPVLGRVRPEWNFNLVRRRAHGAAGFDGVIVVTVFPSYFVDFWRQTRAPLESATTLIRGDLKILARDPSADMEALAPESDGAKAIARAELGSFRAVSTADGVDRLFAYRRIAPFDAFVAYGIGVEAGLERWRDHLMVYGGGFGAAACGLVCLSMVAMRRAQREHDAIRQRLTVERQLHQAQKMEAIGQFTGGIVHDLNNLLTAMLGNLDLLRGMQSSPVLEERVSAAVEAAERAERTIGALLAFARSQPARAETVHVGTVCQEMRNMFRQVLGSRVRLDLDIGAALWPVEIEKNQLELALLNLVVNARDAMPDGGTLRIGCSNVRLAGTPNGLHGDFVTASIGDTGTGMAPEVLARIFEPFYTTKEAGRGTGLGLSQVRSFAAHAGGSVTADSALGRGTTITLYLRATTGSSEHIGGRAIVAA
jgi:two-component system NtrC family sensor kinase